MGEGVVSPAAVRASLTPDERLLEYMVANDRVVLFVASRDSIHAIEQRADLKAMIQRVRLLVTVVSRMSSNRLHLETP